jgi:hypothetical protein
MAMSRRDPSISRRVNKRVLTASVTSVGIALAASLYPIPGESSLLDLFPPQGGSTQSGPPADQLHIVLVDRDAADGLPSTMWHLTFQQSLGGDPAMAAIIADLAAETLSDFVDIYGFPAVILALNTLARSDMMIPGGGHGGWGGLPLGPSQGVMPTLLILLDFLGRELPALFVTDSPAFVAMVWPAVLRSLGLLVATEPTPAEGQMSAAATAEHDAEHAATPLPEPTHSEPASVPEPAPSHQANPLSEPESPIADFRETTTEAAPVTAPTAGAPGPNAEGDGDGTPQDAVIVDVDPGDAVEEPLDVQPAENTPTSEPDPSQANVRPEPEDNPPQDDPPDDDGPDDPAGE